MTDPGGSGSYNLSGPGAAPPSESELIACADALDHHTGGYGSVDLGGTATLTTAAGTDSTRTATGDVTVNGGSTAADKSTTNQFERVGTATPLLGTEATPVSTTESSSGVVTPGFGVGVVVLAVLLFGH